MSYDTQFRPDGNFFVRCVCKGCGEEYFLHALPNSSVDSGNCGSCEQEIWELETMFGKHSVEATK